MSVSMRYFDVIATASALGMMGAFASTAVQQIWNYKDITGLGILLVTISIFLLLRQRAYAQKTPWLLFCVAGLALAAMVVLLRRWSVIWIALGSIMFLFGLVTRSNTIAEPVSRRNIFAVLSILMSFLLSLALVEGALRLYPDMLPVMARLRIVWEGGDRSWYVPHPYIGYLHNPDARARDKTPRPGRESTTIDIWGFRNAWPWPEQAEIIAVGDSMTYSQNVRDDEAWTEILDRALPHSRILNFGLIGSGPQQYLRVYETFGIGLKPKLLLVGLFLGNDLYDARSFDRWWKAGGEGSFLEFGRKQRDWMTRMVRKSYLFHLLNEVRDSYKSGRLVGDRVMELADGGRVRLVPNALANSAVGSQPGDLAFTLVLETVERIQALAKQNQTRCLVLFFPQKEEVYLPLLGEKAANLAASFLPELDKRGIAYLDLGPYFRKRAAAGETLFWEVDGHPNPRGNALIAEVILAHLAENAKTYGLSDWEADTGRPIKD